jgi:hypothetical protein
MSWMNRMMQDGVKNRVVAVERFAVGQLKERGTALKGVPHFFDGASPETRIELGR